MQYQGRCHCGAVKFEADIDLSQGLSQCNCTICTRRGSLTAVVKPEAFRLLSGDEQVAKYRPGEGYYNFCRNCGIHLFGEVNLEMLGGAIVAINVNCIDDMDLTGTTISYVDGRNDSWQVLRTEKYPDR